MKKFLLSFLTIVSFFSYVVFWGKKEILSTASVPESSPSPIPTPAPAPVPKPTPVPKPAPTPVPKPVGQYRDGNYTGNRADAYYGYIKVKAVIENGKLADVIFLDYPQDRNTSVKISNYAMPILKSEAIKSQNADVGIVSGATDSSIAFRESLANALAQAKN